MSVVVLAGACSALAVAVELVRRLDLDAREDAGVLHQRLATRDVDVLHGRVGTGAAVGVVRVLHLVRVVQERVVPEPGEHRVLAAATGDEVIAGTAVDRVVAVAGVDHGTEVVLRVGEDAVGRVDLVVTAAGVDVVVHDHRDVVAAAEKDVVTGLVGVVELLHVVGVVAGVDGHALVRLVEEDLVETGARVDQPGVVPEGTSGHDAHLHHVVAGAGVHGEPLAAVGPRVGEQHAVDDEVGLQHRERDESHVGVDGLGDHSPEHLDGVGLAGAVDVDRPVEQVDADRRHLDRGRRDREEGPPFHLLDHDGPDGLCDRVVGGGEGLLDGSDDEAEDVGHFESPRVKSD